MCIRDSYSRLDASVSEVKDTTTAQEGKIAEFRARELRLQEEINALKDRPISVSYTHLDVYKRQGFLYLLFRLHYSLFQFFSVLRQLLL